MSFDLRKIGFLLPILFGPCSSLAQDPFAEQLNKELGHYVDRTMERMTEFYAAYDRLILNLASQSLYASMPEDKVVWRKAFSNGAFIRESSIKKNEVLYCGNSVSRQEESVEITAQCVSNEILSLSGQTIFLNSTALSVAHGFRNVEALDIIRPLFRPFVVSKNQADHINQNYQFKLRKSIHENVAEITLEVEATNREATKAYLPFGRVSLRILDCEKNQTIFENWFGEFKESQAPKYDYSCKMKTASSHREVMRLAQWLLKTAAAN